MSKKPWLFLAITAFVAAGEAFAQTSLFYLEGQGVAGYSSARERWVFYSLRPAEVMQKPSLGFDYVQRFSGEGGDFATLAVQGRLAINGDDGLRTVEPQLYNAYIKLKTRFADIWAGHNRPAFGLASVFDTHGLLLQTLAMEGYGFDRDWGVGLSRDFSRGNWAVSLTSGSGFPLRFKGNYLAAARVALGVLNRDNYSVGLSAGWGKTLDTMGYEFLSPAALPFRIVAADVSYLWNNIENRLEVAAGKRLGESAFAVFWRLGVNWLEENRLKWEFQPVLRREAGRTFGQYSTGVSYQATGDVALRAMYVYDGENRDSRIAVQVYFYKRLVI